jgi:hypothetical protein
VRVTCVMAAFSERGGWNCVRVGDQTRWSGFARRWFNCAWKSGMGGGGYAV